MSCYEYNAGLTGQGRQRPKVSILQQRGCKWAWSLTGLFLHQEQKLQETAVVPSGSGQILQPFVQFTLGKTEAWGIRGLLKASFDL